MTVGPIFPEMHWLHEHLITVLWLILCGGGLVATYVIKVVA